MNSQVAKSEAVLFLERVRQGTKAFRPVVWPGTEEQIGVVVPLTCAESDASVAGAWAHFNEMKVEVNLYSSDDFHSELNIQVVSRALRKTDDHNVRLFSSPDELRSYIRPDERTALTTEYVALLNEVNPSPSDVTPELMERIGDAVKKKDVLTLSACDSSLLATWLVTTEFQLVN
jgi:hypothetical protein